MKRCDNGKIIMIRLEIQSNFEGAETLIRSAVYSEIKRLEIGLRKTDQEIRKFEEKYQIPSRVFIEEYAAEDLDGGDDEYISWMGELKIRRKIASELQNLKGTEYVAQRISA